MARGLPRRKPIEDVKKIICISSGKGGVGKSTSAVNLAVAMTQLDTTMKVGILDADVYGPSIPTLMNLSGSPALDSNNKMVPLTNYGIKCMSMGFLISPTSALVWRGLMVMSAIEKLIRQVQWGPLDLLIVDMPPGTGDVQLSMVQSVPVAGVVLLTTPQTVALSDVRRCATMFSKLDVPIIGIVDNMTVFACPGCGRTHRIFGRGGAGVLARELSLSILGEIPLDEDICKYSDTGCPVVFAKPCSAQALSYKAVAKSILERVS